jgi:hypothetical protein
MGNPLMSRIIQDGVVVERVVMSPDFARSILERNYSKNRNIDKFIVERYAQDMRERRWQDNGETIKISENDYLLDGQHRLMAVVKSGASIPVTIVWGLHADVFKTIDRGKTRSIADSLKIDGETNCKTLSAVLTWVQRWESRDGGIPTTTVKRMTPQLASVYLAKHPTIRESIQFLNKKSGVLRGICAPGIVAFAHYLLKNIHKELADSMFNQLLTGAGLSSGHPVLVARERMRQMKSDRATYMDYEYLAILIMAWNANRKGKDSVRNFFWRRTETVYPNPI